MDVARCRSHNMLEALGLNRLRFGSSHIDLYSDSGEIDNKVRVGGCYYSARNAVFERRVLNI
jgi:hypothetical protein